MNNCEWLPGSAPFFVERDLEAKWVAKERPSCRSVIDEFAGRAGLWK